MTQIREIEQLLPNQLVDGYHVYLTQGKALEIINPKFDTNDSQTFFELTDSELVKALNLHPANKTPNLHQLIRSIYHIVEK